VEVEEVPHTIMWEPGSQHLLYVRAFKEGLLLSDSLKDSPMWIDYSGELIIEWRVPGTVTPIPITLVEIEYLVWWWHAWERKYVDPLYEDDD